MTIGAIESGGLTQQIANIRLYNQEYLGYREKIEMSIKRYTFAEGKVGQSGLTRRTVLKGSLAAATAATTLSGFPYISRAGQPFEVVHWNMLAASDGEIWGQMINAFNDAHKDKGIQIRSELVDESQYLTKLLTAASSGAAPDFGWGPPRMRYREVKEGIVIPLDEWATKVGLDWNDFNATAVEMTKYPKFGDGKYSVPMDLMSLQPLINLDHVADSGLNADAAPTNGDELIEWAKAMTRKDGDTITRSGIMMTGTGVHPAATWGIIATQMGFKRVSDDLKTAAVNEEAGIAAMQWVLDLFDKHKVSTRDITDRYKAFGNGQGSIFWTGPWTLNGYVSNGLNFKSAKFPKVGSIHATYFDMGALELYAQKDTSRYEMTMGAIKWLSDNSLLWTTKGRGATPRKSIAASDAYKNGGYPWPKRGAFIDGLDIATIGEVPVPDAPDFSIYYGGALVAKTLEGVWAGLKTPEQGMAELKSKWQESLDKIG
jgi:ABC-type glycerol-3-phosphate transport system substrate-binding protein